MRIRTQLILAAFVLAVIPLAAIVIYSYHSSRRALENAYRREAERLTRQMDQRLASIRADLDQRLRVVSALPLAPGQSSADVGNIVTVMGDAAHLVDALDFEPLHEGNPDPNPVDEAEPAVEGDESQEPAEPAAPAPAPAPPAAPVVIDIPELPPLPRFVMSEEQQELVAEVARLAGRLADPNLTGDEREDLREEMNHAQQELGRVIDQDQQQFQAQMRQAQAVRRERQAALDASRRNVPAPRATPRPRQVAASPAPKVKVQVRGATAKDLQKAADVARKTSLLLGRSFEAPVRQQGEIVGQLSARVSTEQVVRRVLGGASDDRTELPFAVDREGTVYTRSPDERGQLDALGIPQRVREGRTVKGIEGWIVSVSTDPQSGLRFGVARPVGDNLEDLRRAAARNFVLGLGLIAFAVVGIVPLSNHLTRDVKLVTDGAERIAQGDLMTRLPVRTKNEIGQLARAFNRMAEDLSIHQQKLVEQERVRREQELHQRLLEVEYERKSVELEDARRFQLSMLPKAVPAVEGLDVSVFTRTATEVGGDYYDFHVADGRLVVTIGDATGHGAKAGTMVTVIKTLFAGYGGDEEPAEFLRGADDKIKRMDLGRMAMALALARFENHRLTIASAGMPPVLVHRAGGEAVEEVSLPATPLGTLRSEYPQTTIDLAAGDTVLFLSDGFPELLNHAGQQLGYTAALEAFATAAREATAERVIGALADVARKWHGETPPNDDVTFVVVRIA